MLYKGFDASVPPVKAPPGARFVLGYLGRPGFTPHVWSLAEWLRFQTMRQFPAWLPDYGQRPEDEARLAASIALKMGWRNDGTRVIVADTEDKIVRAWYQRWAAGLARAGYLECNYGSLGTAAAPIVERNGSKRIWAAAWDGDPVLEGGQLVMAHQYAADVPVSTSLVDLDVMEEALFLLGGAGPRRSEP